MEREIVREKVFMILDSMGYDISEIDEDNLYFDIGMDSLESVEYLIALENEFEMTISDLDMEEMYHSQLGTTITMIYEMLNNKE